MLDEFTQHNREQPLDTLPENSALPWNKKIVLLCLAIGFIGLFIFFTSGSWSEQDSSASDRDSLVHEVELLKARVLELEQQAPQQTAAASVPQPNAEPSQTVVADPVQPITPSLDNLKSLIEQELQQTASTTQGAETNALAPKEYVVKNGDNLSKISKQFYGTPHRWKKIVNANKEKLGHNNVLRPGMKLIIPAEA